MDEVLERGDKRCKNCKHPIRKINFVMGEQWLHVNHYSSFPTTQNGGLWRSCKISIAEPEDE